MAVGEQGGISTTPGPEGQAWWTHIPSYKDDWGPYFSPEWDTDLDDYLEADDGFTDFNSTGYGSFAYENNTPESNTFWSILWGTPDENSEDAYPPSAPWVYDGETTTGEWVDETIITTETVTVEEVIGTEDDGEYFVLDEDGNPIMDDGEYVTITTDTDVEEEPEFDPEDFENDYISELPWWMTHLAQQITYEDITEAMQSPAAMSNLLIDRLNIPATDASKYVQFFQKYDYMNDVHSREQFRQDMMAVGLEGLKEIRNLRQSMRDRIQEMGFESVGTFELDRQLSQVLDIAMKRQSDLEMNFSRDQYDREQDYVDNFFATLTQLIVMGVDSWFVDAREQNWWEKALETFSDAYGLWQAYQNGTLVDWITNYFETEINTEETISTWQEETHYEDPSLPLPPGWSVEDVVIGVDGIDILVPGYEDVDEDEVWDKWREEYPELPWPPGSGPDGGGGPGPGGGGDDEDTWLDVLIGIGMAGGYKVAGVTGNIVALIALAAFEYLKYSYHFFSAISTEEAAEQFEEIAGEHLIDPSQPWDGPLDPTGPNTFEGIIGDFLEWVSDKTEGAAEQAANAATGVTVIIVVAAIIKAAVCWFVCCMPGWSLIDTRKGRIRIEDLKKGDYVLSPNGGETKITDYHVYPSNITTKYNSLEFDDGGIITVDPNHRILNKRSRDFKVGDILNGKKIIDISEVSGYSVSYDIQTEDGNYMMNGIEVNTMIPRLNKLINLIHNNMDETGVKKWLQI